MTNSRPRLTALLSLFFMAPSVAFNAAAQLAHQQEPLVLWGSLALSTGSVALAAILPVAILKAPGLFARVVLGVSFVVLLAFNLANGVGAVSTAKSSLTGSRRADNSRLALLQSQLSQDEASRKALAAAAGEQTPAMADAALAALRQDAKWTRSKACADATRDDSRFFCAEYAQKQAVRDAAAKMTELDARIAALRAQIGAAQTASAGESEDPQADAVATTVGMIWARPALHAISVLISVQSAVVAEILPAVASLAFAMTFQKNAAPSEPASSAPKRSSAHRWRRVWAGQRRRTQIQGAGQKEDKSRPPSNGRPSPAKELTRNAELGQNGQKLSKRERDKLIAQLASAGQTQTEIAAKMGVSIRTVRRVAGGAQAARKNQNVIPMKRSEPKD